MVGTTNELVISSGGKERIERAATALHPLFKTDPVVTYLLSSLSQADRLAYLPAYFSSLLTAAGLNGAQFDEIDDWASCAVWIPPGKKVDNPMTWIPSGLFPLLWKIGFGGFWKMVVEFTGKVDAARHRGLKGQKKCYYLFFIGTQEDRRHQGLTHALIRRYQSISRKDGIPLWLEATTLYSSTVYKKYGFELTEEIVLGKGIAGADGMLAKGGEGVILRSMVWWPNRDGDGDGDE